MLDHESCKKVHSGNGLTREWSYDFPLPDAAYMKVYVSGPSSPPALVPRSGYRVDMEARRVVYPASEDADALPDGWTLTLMRELPLLQPITLLNQQGRFFAADTENGLDRSVMMIQQLAEAAGRAISAPLDGSVSAEELAAQVMDTHARYEEISGKHEEVIAARDAAFASAVAAESAEDQARGAKESAQSAAAAALSAMTATLEASAVPAWDETEDYDYPQLVCCPDGNNYRAITHSAAGTYPPESPDTWVCVTIVRAPGTYDFESGGTFNDTLTAVETGGTF